MDGTSPLNEILWWLTHALWVLFAGLQMRWLWKARPDRELRWLLPALFLGSFLIRWFLFIGGPGDLRLNLTDAVWPGHASSQGNAPPVFFKLIGLGTSFPHLGTATMAVNTALASLVPCLFMLLLGEFKFSRRTALLAATATSLLPLLLLFSKVLNRQPLYLFLAFTSLYHAAGFLRRKDGVRLGLVLVSTSLAILCRPEGAGLLICHCAMVAFLPGERNVRLGLAAIYAALIGLSIPYLSGLDGAHGLWANEGRSQLLDAAQTLFHLAVVAPLITPAVHALGWLAGFVVCVPGRRRLAIAAIAVVLGMAAVWSITQLSSHLIGFRLQLASARYQTLLSFPVLIGTALLFERLDMLSTTRRRWAWSLLLVLYSASYVLPINATLRPRTIDLEYHFLADTLPRLPQDAEVLYIVPPANDLGLMDINSVALYVGRPDIRFVEMMPAQVSDLRAGRSGGVHFYYAGSLCAEVIPHQLRPFDRARYHAMLEACQQTRVKLSKEPNSIVAAQSIPARPFAWYDYNDSHVDLLMARIQNIPPPVAPPHNQP